MSDNFFKKIYFILVVFIILTTALMVAGFYGDYENALGIRQSASDPSSQFYQSWEGSYSRNYPLPTFIPVYLTTLIVLFITLALPVALIIPLTYIFSSYHRKLLVSLAFIVGGLASIAYSFVDALLVKKVLWQIVWGVRCEDTCGIDIFIYIAISVIYIITGIVLLIRQLLVKKNINDKS